MKLSIIIVNYNVTRLLARCLASIERYAKPIHYEVMVVDNASPDASWKGLKEQFPTVTFIESPENLGFAKANNLAVGQAVGEYILLLNPDTELEDEGLQAVLDFAEAKERLGCVGVRLHDAQGNFLPESKRAVPNLSNSFEKLFTNFKQNNAKSYYRDDIAETEIAEVAVITGAFFLCRRAVYQQVGGLDERYFMYGEDIDLCYTLLQHGFQNYYYGAMSILHIKGESSTKDRIYLQRFYGAMQLFLDKYYHKNPLQYHLLSLGLRVKHLIERLKLWF